MFSHKTYHIRWNIRAPIPNVYHIFHDKSLVFVKIETFKINTRLISYNIAKVKTEVWLYYI